MLKKIKFNKYDNQRTNTTLKMLYLSELNSVNWWEIDKFCIKESLYETPVLNMTSKEFYYHYIKKFCNNVSEVK